MAQLYPLLAVLLLVAAGVWLLYPKSGPAPVTSRTAEPGSADSSHTPPPSATPPASLPKAVPTARAVPPPAAAPASEEPYELPSLDPDDIAAYISPDDPEPTMAELIDALNHAGIHDGLGAFNPPGTSPPLPGLAVPDDFALPEGYVRHHQVTDQGEPIEPILMFSPDYTFYDDAGQPIEVPADRVVPAELAPPGLPIRPIEIPPPPPAP